MRRFTTMVRAATAIEATALIDISTPTSWLSPAMRTIAHARTTADKAIWTAGHVFVMRRAYELHVALASFSTSSVSNRSDPRSVDVTGCYGTVTTTLPRTLSFPRRARAAAVSVKGSTFPTTGRMTPASTRAAISAS